MSSPHRIRDILIVTDAWDPQVNGVVRTLKNTQYQLQQYGLRVQFLTPNDFKTVGCPGYPEIRLALAQRTQVEMRIRDIDPDALHIATEGPLGWAARSAAIRNGWAYTTAYHTRFPEYLSLRTGLPARWFYRFVRAFHAHSSSVLVPTAAIARVLRDQGFQRLRHWTRGVDHRIFFPRTADQGTNKQNPVFLYAGRLAIEKNLEAFLDLDLPGEKWVVGDGPIAPELRRRYRDVRWSSTMSQYELAAVYRQADVFVFPSLTDTFGLVMAEALACGLPVAAFPVPGPLDVIGDSGAGSLNTDLREACLACLEIPRSKAIARARDFTWERASAQFIDALVPLLSDGHLAHRKPAERFA
jgi:glycosyltransferase involved in cell wall biosynthesis